MRPHPKHTITDPTNPRCWGTSDRSGMIYNHGDLCQQKQWAGNQLIDTGLLVGPDELDTPAEFLRSMVLPPDPSPIMNARPEPYFLDETDFLATEAGDPIITEDGEYIVPEGNNWDGEIPGM